MDKYWNTNYFDNNWHYVRKWDHLKDAKSLFPLSTDIKSALETIKTTHFEQSDYFIGRNISCLIKLSWTEPQVKERAAKMVNAIKASL